QRPSTRGAKSTHPTPAVYQSAGGNRQAYSALPRPTASAGQARSEHQRGACESHAGPGTIEFRFSSSPLTLAARQPGRIRAAILWLCLVGRRGSPAAEIRRTLRALSDVLTTFGGTPLRLAFMYEELVGTHVTSHY